MACANVSNIPGAEPFATLIDEIVDSIVFPELTSEPEGAPAPEGASAAAAADLRQRQPAGDPA